jgi:hypothetical protein
LKAIKAFNALIVDWKGPPSKEENALTTTVFLADARGMEYEKQDCHVELCR